MSNQWIHYITIGSRFIDFLFKINGIPSTIDTIYHKNQSPLEGSNQSRRKQFLNKTSAAYVMDCHGNCAKLTLCTTVSMDDQWACTIVSKSVSRMMQKLLARLTDWLTEWLTDWLLIHQYVHTLHYEWSSADIIIMSIDLCWPRAWIYVIFCPDKTSHRWKEATKAEGNNFWIKHLLPMSWIVMEIALN